MSKIPRLGNISYDAYMDDISIKGVKYTHHAHLGELFEVENAPFDYISKVKKIKVMKNLIAHKVDLTNLNVVGFLIRQRQKLLDKVSNYGPWHKEQLEKMKRKLIRTKHIKASINDTQNWKFLPFLTHLEQLSIEVEETNQEENNDNNQENQEVELEAQQNQEENEDRDSAMSEEETDNKPKKAVFRYKAFRLPKLRKIVIEGGCSKNLIRLLESLSHNLKYLPSLQEVEFKSLQINSNQAFISSIRKLEIFRFVKSIQVSYCDFSESLIRVIENAEHLPRLEYLSGLISSEIGFDASVLSQFNSLKEIDVTFFRGNTENSEKALTQILTTVKFPTSLETLKVNYVHIETGTLHNLITLSESFKQRILGNLPNLKTVSFSTAVNPAISSKAIAAFFQTTQGIKNLQLDVTNALFTENLDSIEQFPLADIFVLVKDSIPEMKSLILRLPKISLNNLPETGVQFSNLEELSLDGNFGLSNLVNTNALLRLLNPQKLKKLSLHEITSAQGEGNIYEQLEKVKEFSKLQKLSLIYKDLEVEEKMLTAFKNVFKAMSNISYIFIKLGKDGENFQNFNKKLIQSALEIPSMQFIKIEPYRSEEKVEQANE